MYRLRDTIALRRLAATGVFTRLLVGFGSFRPSMGFWSLVRQGMQEARPAMTTILLHQLCGQMFNIGREMSFTTLPPILKDHAQYGKGSFGL